MSPPVTSEGGVVPILDAWNACNLAWISLGKHPDLRLENVELPADEVKGTPGRLAASTGPSGVDDGVVIPSEMERSDGTCL